MTVPPFSTTALFNQRIPEGYAAHTNNATITAAFLTAMRAAVNMRATDLGDTPPLNRAKRHDPVLHVVAPNVDTYIRVPRNLKIATGTDFPTIILDPHPHPGPVVAPAVTTGGGVDVDYDQALADLIENRRKIELRLWRAVYTRGVGLTGQGGSLLAYSDTEPYTGSGDLPALGHALIGGATGSGCTYHAGLLRRHDILYGRIKHALRFAYSNAHAEAGYLHQFPAIASDRAHPGGATPVPAANECVKMGQYFQLDPTLDISDRCAPGYAVDTTESRFVRIVCRCLQEYGMFVADNVGPNIANIYMENTQTAGWKGVIGPDGDLNRGYGWALRSLDLAPSGWNTPVPTLATEGVPWSSIRAIAPPFSHTEWVAP